MTRTLLAICGAVIGGVVGYFAFFWIARQGYYGMILPGGLLGLGAGVARSRSLLLAVGCGLAALALGLFTQWQYTLLSVNESLGDFLAHVHQLRSITLVMILLGGVIGFWIPFRRAERGANSDGKRE